MRFSSSCAAILLLVLGACNIGDQTSAANSDESNSALGVWVKGGGVTGTEWTSGPISYRFNSTPATYIKNVMDTVGRAWATLYTEVGLPCETCSKIFYEGYPEDEADIEFSYVPTDFPSTWDYTIVSPRKMTVRLHSSVGGNPIDWSNRQFVYYYLANLIGRTVYGRPSSADPSDILWTPSSLTSVTNFPHAFSVNDIGWYNGIYRPLFREKNGGVWGKIFTGWDSARIREQQGQGYVLLGAVTDTFSVATDNPYRPGRQLGEYLVYIKTRSTSPATVNRMSPVPARGLSINCTDAYDPTLKNAGGKRDFSAFGDLALSVWDNTIEYGTLYANSSTGGSTPGSAGPYNIVHASGPYACQVQIGVYATLRYLAP